MANLTITIDDALLKLARMRALEQGTSVNALLRDYLEAYAGSAELQKRALADLLDTLGQRGLTEGQRRMDARRPSRARGGPPGRRRAVRVFVDTNVLVYLFDADAPTKQERAREVVSELARNSSLVVSSQVLSELYVTVTRKLAHPLDPAAALRALADLAVFPVVAIDAALVQRAAVRAVSEQIAYWDALILDAAVEAGAGTVYSEDLQQGRTYQGVTVVDPFAT